MNPEMNANRIVCHECDLLQRADAVPRRGSLRCARCNAPLLRWASNNLDVPVALALTAAVTFIIANIFPVMTLEFDALRMDASMVAAVWQLHTRRERRWSACWCWLRLSSRPLS